VTSWTALEKRVNNATVLLDQAEQMYRGLLNPPDDLLEEPQAMDVITGAVALEPTRLTLASIAESLQVIAALQLKKALAS
jgi:hypothetical protein